MISIVGAWARVRVGAGRHRPSRGRRECLAVRFEGGRVTTLLSEAQLPTLDAARRELMQAYVALTREASRSPEELDEMFAYRNVQGVDMRVPRWVILRHVVNHATYHRGQLASMLRMLDQTAPATDFTVWVIERQAAPSRDQ